MKNINLKNSLLELKISESDIMKIIKNNLLGTLLTKRVPIFFSIVLLFIMCFYTNAFAAKYTIVNGQDFNARIKMSIDSSYNSSTPDATILAFKAGTSISESADKIIDISEDGDGTVLAYIDNGIIYYVADDEVYLNQDASYMFDKFVNIREINLSELNFSKTRKTNFMFSSCKNLKNVNMDNDSIIKLNEMKGMFFDCESIENINAYMLDTKNVSDMKSLFAGCVNLKNIFVTKNIFSLSKVTNFLNMFTNCTSLKTNFGTLAISIPETSYKLFAKCGDDNVEGLLKDVDFDYDDYGERIKSVKIDTKLYEDDENQNISSKITNSSIKDSLLYSDVAIATSSTYYEQFANASIKNGKKTLSSRLISETVEELPTVDGVPILLDETTEADIEALRNKKRQKENEKYGDIVPQEVSTDSVTTNGILRPDYADETINSKETTITESNSVSNDNEEENTTIDFSFIYIILGMLAIIILSIIFTLFKTKHDNGGLSDGSI